MAERRRRAPIPYAQRHSFLLEAEAQCSDCGWTAEGSNAVAIAAQHAGRLNHSVAATQTIATNYNRRAP